MYDGSDLEAMLSVLCCGAINASESRQDTASQAFWGVSFLCGYKRGQGNGERSWKACCEAKMPFRRAMLKLA